MSMFLTATLWSPVTVAQPATRLVVEPYPGSTLDQEEIREFDGYQRIVGLDADSRSLTEAVEGRVTRQRHKNPAGRSTFEILANYREALEGQGFVACEGADGCGNRGVGRLDIPGWNSINGINLGIAGDVRYLSASRVDGNGRAWVSVAVNPATHFVHVVEQAAMQAGLVKVTAEALGDDLSRTGKAVVDGIFFDTDSDRLRPESDEALAQVAALLDARPALKLWVVGHTDMTGAFARNLELSRARAAAVVAALVQRHGIDASRLEAHGVGPLAPAASNRSDDGRQLNRRVEIVERPSE
jgi:outer membrane protein OmpA-like peptidoglycan-associated protein